MIGTCLLSFFFITVACFQLFEASSLSWRHGSIISLQNLSFLRSSVKFSPDRNWANLCVSNKLF